MQPVLIACSHGTANDDGQQAIHQLRRDIAAQRPGLDVREAYVDVQHPQLPAVLDGLPAGAPAVVVPLLLSVGFHTKVDIARAVRARREDPTGGPTGAAKPLGPDDRLAALLQRRLQEAKVPDSEPVVLAAAGSSRSDAAAAVEDVAERLRQLRETDVVVGYGASARPTVAEAVTELRAANKHAAIASYLLAPGYFHDQLAKAGADVVTVPLLPDDSLAQIALDRFDAAVSAGSAVPSQTPEGILKV
ncbi:sirohydrochlorin chelatase [Arthrobacter pigmenti]